VVILHRLNWRRGLTSYLECCDFGAGARFRRNTVSALGSTAYETTLPVPPVVKIDAQLNAREVEHPMIQLVFGVAYLFSSEGFPDQIIDIFLGWLGFV
jgi:hypothetical protein